MNSVLHKTLDHIIWIGPGKLDEIPESLKETKCFTMYEASDSCTAYLEKKYSDLKNIFIINRIIEPNECTHFHHYNEPYFDGLTSIEKLKNTFPGLHAVHKEQQTHLPFKEIICDINPIDKTGLIVDFLDDELCLINSLKENELAKYFTMITILTSVEVNVIERMQKHDFYFVSSSEDRFGNIQSTFIRNPLYLERRDDEKRLLEQSKNNKILTENLDKLEGLLRESETNLKNSENKKCAESYVDKCKKLEQKLEYEEIKALEQVTKFSSLEVKYETLKSTLEKKVRLLVEHESKSYSLEQRLEKESKKNADSTQLSIEYRKDISSLNDSKELLLAKITKLEEKLVTADKTLLLNTKLMNKLQCDSDDLREKIKLLNVSEKGKIELITELYNKLQNAANFMKYLRENHPTVLDDFR
ncbi:hypothetical protein Q4602_00920 [Paraglaciecola chathamensis]|uniref:hypothetical protein n=1 Tax=Paraglaciecola chathamensis TaxID=368405 RepID=UPI0027100ABB|nr:hypothetical protein [Paraglaciecola chathamensis]MDO6838021.1 hypothetical protein [Paraglaciecola chathamensis]